MHCYVLDILQFFMNLYDAFMHILQGCFASNRPIRLPHFWWSNHDEFGSVWSLATHNKTTIMCDSRAWFSDFNSLCLRPRDRVLHVKLHTFPATPCITFLTINRALYHSGCYVSSLTLHVYPWDKSYYVYNCVLITCRFVSSATHYLTIINVIWLGSPTLLKQTEDIIATSSSLPSTSRVIVLSSLEGN